MEQVKCEEVMELLQPTMNWVSQMYNELMFVSNANYSRFTAEPGHVFTYRERMVDLFGEDFVKEMGEQDSLTMVELSDRCEAWATTLWQMLDQGDERVNNELEDVAFWSGEIFRSIEIARKMCVKFGWSYNDCIEGMLNDAGADYVGTRKE